MQEWRDESSRDYHSVAQLDLKYRAARLNNVVEIAPLQRGPNVDAIWAQKPRQELKEKEHQIL